MAADLPVGQLSLLGHTKLVCLERYAEDVLRRGIVGDVAEVGVYKGGSARLLCLTFPQRPIHLFDTFRGMPFQGDIDFHPVGDFGDTSLCAVQSLLQDCENAQFHVGLFPETAAGLEHHRFAFVHVDGDQYRTTLDALNFFYPRMSSGGILVFDDYEWVRCPGVKAALSEFMADKPEAVEDLGNCQAMVRKA